MEDRICRIFEKGGSLSFLLKGYEERLSQKKMALDVFNSFSEGLVAILEAPTGIGKSLAYLVPAILWIEEFGERVVISTNTIHLQEQLLLKDIPLALKVTDSSVKVTIAKGMKNYLCLRNLEEESSSFFFEEEQYAKINAIEKWARSSASGSRTDLPFPVSRELWQRVGASSDSCTEKACPAFFRCFYFKARKAIEESKLIICNHHLLFSDLALKAKNKNFDDSAVLPPYERLILDEAHHIEDIAAEHLSEKVSKGEIQTILSELFGKKDEVSVGLFFELKKKISRVGEEVSRREVNRDAIDKKILYTFPEILERLTLSISEFFDSLITFEQQFSSSRFGSNDVGNEKERKLRLEKFHFTLSPFKKGILPKFLLFKEALLQLLAEIHILEEELKDAKDKQFHEDTKSIRQIIKIHKERLQGLMNTLEAFLSEKCSETAVRWYEVDDGINKDVRLVLAQHDISALLNDHLFEKNISTILSSATLTSKSDFSYIKGRLGLKDKETLDVTYTSPFNFEKQVLFGVPSDMLPPLSQNYLSSLSQALISLIKASNGGAFVLFTSYRTLHQCYIETKEALNEMNINLLRQNDEEKMQLIHRFKTEPRSVLFATDSFWEGVDLAGGALRSVIITKLPFVVPTDPLAKARSDFIDANGGSGFYDYSIPKAVVKFKQAFGRLIRCHSDRGCVICLDVRIINKSYGSYFFDSLPECYKVQKPLSELSEEIKQFFRKLERNGFEPMTSTMPLLRSTN